jgi:hypothetical protein
MYMQEIELCAWAAVALNSDAKASPAISAFLIQSSENNQSNKPSSIEGLRAVKFKRRGIQEVGDCRRRALKSQIVARPSTECW